MNEQIKNDEMEIDLREVFSLLLRKLWMILLCFILGAGIALGYTKLLVTPMYESTSMIYILSKTTSVSSAIDLQLSKQLTIDFEILAKSRPVVEQVIDKLNLDLSYEEAVKQITIDNPDNTNILKLSARDADARLACDMANAMADATAARIAEVMVTERPSTVENAVVSSYPVSPVVLQNVLIGGLVGALLMMAVILTLYLMDDTIKTEEDVKKYLNVSTLASLPVTKKNIKKRTA